MAASHTGSMKITSNKPLTQEDILRLRKQLGWTTRNTRYYRRILADVTLSEAPVGAPLNLKAPKGI